MGNNILRSFGVEIEATTSNGSRVINGAEKAVEFSLEEFKKGTLPEHRILSPEVSAKNVEGGSAVSLDLAPRAIDKAVYRAFSEFEETLNLVGIKPIYTGIDFSMPREEAEKCAVHTPRYQAMVNAFSNCTKAYERWNKSKIHLQDGTKNYDIGIYEPKNLYFLTAPTRAFQPNFGLSEEHFASVVNCWHWFLPVLIAPLVGTPIFDRKLTKTKNMRHLLWSMMAGNRYHYSPFKAGWYPKGLTIESYLEAVNQIEDLIHPKDNRKSLCEVANISKEGILKTKISTVWPLIRVKYGNDAFPVIGEVRAIDSLPFLEASAVSVAFLLIAELFGKSDYACFNWEDMWKSIEAVAQDGLNAYITFGLPGETARPMPVLEASRTVYEILEKNLLAVDSDLLSPIVEILNSKATLADKIQKMTTGSLDNLETELVQFYLESQNKPICDWDFNKM
jgi:hypothetical protein